MSNTNRDRFNVIRALAAAFPHNKVTPATIAAYDAFLADMHISDLKRAAAYCIANSEFFPTMYALREAAQKSDANRPPTAGEAWYEIKRAFHTHGSWKRPEWSHPLVGKAVAAMGGWKDLCLSEDPEGVIRGQFIKLYNVLEERGAQDQRARALTVENKAWDAIGGLADKLALPGGGEE
jgi:hypothetical protein